MSTNTLGKSSIGHATTPTTATKFWDTGVAWWATAGALLLAFEVYVMVKWVMSEDFRPSLPGVTPLPEWMKIAVTACCISTFLLAVWMIWRFIYKPWRHEGHLTLDAAFGLGTLCMWWQDPLQNIFIPWFSYNFWLPNWGSWANQVPWISQVHADRLGHPLYASIPGFMLLYFGGMLVGKVSMEWAKKRNPNISTVKLVWLSLAVCTVVMMVLEMVWMRTGFYVYPYVIEDWTLFAGHYYQIPIYENIILGISIAAGAWLVYFRNDKGETIVERGLSGLKIPQGQKSVLRFLSVMFMINVFFGLYDIVLQPFILNADNVTKDIAERSYFSGEYCGPGKDIACWDKSLPIPTKYSARVNPEGKLVPGPLPMAKSWPYKTTAD